MTKAQSGNLGRIFLADMTIEDLSIYREWFLKSKPEMMTCRPIVTRTWDEVVTQFETAAGSDKSRIFAVGKASDNLFLGRVTYFDLNPRNHSAEIGYFIGPEFRGRGYAAEAVALLLKHLFSDLGLNKVMAQTGEFNLHSIRLLEKLGFRIDGRLRQHHEVNGELKDDILYSLLASELKLNF
jgi:RimJ/RimL family protein N-acetyltransferase